MRAMPRYELSLVLFFLYSLITVPLFAADVLYVTNFDDGGPGNPLPGSLRQVIASAHNDDIIVFDPALLTHCPCQVAVRTAPIPINTDITILGPGSELLAVAANPVYSTGIFQINQSIVSIRSLELRSGWALAGSAVRISGGNVHFNTVNFNFNSTGSDGITGQDTGAVDVSGSALVEFIDSTFQENIGVGNGGAVVVSGSFANFIRVAFRNSQARGSRGGAVYGHGGALTTFTDCIFERNSATGGGGAISLSNGNATITRGNFFSNFSFSTNNGFISGNGGAIDADSQSTLNIISSSFDHNQAAFGGALYLAGPVSITNGTFAYNAAHNGGGAMVLFSAQSSIEYNTIVSNSSDVQPQLGSNITGGGGIYAYSPQVILSKSIVANNNGAAGADILGAFVSNGYNLIKNHSDSSGYISTDLSAGMDPKLGALRLTPPGNVKTMMPMMGSPVADVVPVNIGGSGCDNTSTDTYGVIRLHSNAQGCDIGAVEGVDIDTIFYSSLGG